MSTGIIEQLWEEATKSSWPRPGKFTAGEYDYNLQKFAELIVKECTKFVCKQQENAVDNWQCNNGVHIVYELERYFNINDAE